MSFDDVFLKLFKFDLFFYFLNRLISSDALARGIDLPDIEVVISYDPPRHPKTYIHRVGRTARAGKFGTAISLLTETELLRFNVSTFLVLIFVRGTIEGSGH